MVRWIVAAMLLAGTSARAQSVMDKSDTNLRKQDYETVVWLLRSVLLDPYGAQVDNLRYVSDGSICGRINPKDGAGQFKGFTEFLLVPKVGVYKFQVDAGLKPELSSQAKTRSEILSDCSKQNFLPN